MQNLCQIDSFDHGVFKPIARRDFYDSLEALPMELSQFCMKVSLCVASCVSYP